MPRIHTNIHRQSRSKQNVYRVRGDRRYIHEANFAKSAFEVYPRVKFSFVLMRFSLPPRRYTYANKRSSRAIFFLRKPKFMELVYDSHSYSLHPACPSSPLIALTFTYLAFFPRICTYKCVTPSRLNSLQMGRLRRNVFSFLSCILGIGEWGMEGTGKMKMNRGSFWKVERGLIFPTRL